MGKINLTDDDKRIYFNMSFFEQMCWLQEEVEYLFRNNSLEHLREAGIEKYGEPGYGSAIMKLFAIIKADPKNRTYLREVISAEKELISFIYRKNCSYSEEQIRGYWKNYFLSYLHQIESKISQEEGKTNE